MTSSALAWMNDLMQWLGRWFPRLKLVHPTHRAVRFGPSGGAAQKGPGLVLYWPITHELVILPGPDTTQSIHLSGQVKQIAQWPGAILPQVAICRAAVQFRIVDPVRCATKCLHYNALVDNRAQAALARQWPAELNVDRTWIEHTESRLRADLAEFGIAIDRLDVTDLGLGVVMKNMSDWNYADSVNGERPS